MDYLRFYLRTISYSKIFVGINIAMFLLTALIALGTDQLYALVLLGAESRSLVSEGEVWRLLTYSFLHVNILHLLFNMYALWYLGQFVEKYFSREKFVIVYVFTAISASLLSFGWQYLASARSGGGFEYISVGASGAVFGILGLILGNSLMNKRYGMALPINQTNLYVIIAANLLFGFIIPGVDNAAHLGGLVGGVLLAFVLEPSLTFSGNTFKKKLSYTLFVLSLIVLSAAWLLQLATIASVSL